MIGRSINPNKSFTADVERLQWLGTAWELVPDWTIPVAMHAGMAAILPSLAAA